MCPSCVPLRFVEEFHLGRGSVLFAAIPDVLVVLRVGVGDA